MLLHITAHNLLAACKTTNGLHQQEKFSKYFTESYALNWDAEFLYRAKCCTNTEINFEISGKCPKVITINHGVDRRSHDKDIPVCFDNTKDFTVMLFIGNNLIEWELDGEVINRCQTKYAGY